MIAGGAVTNIRLGSVFQLIAFVSAVSIALLALIRSTSSCQELAKFLDNYVLVLSPESIA
jgi:hypothetical protein